MDVLCILKLEGLIARRSHQPSCGQTQRRDRETGAVTRTLVWLLDVRLSAIDG